MVEIQVAYLGKLRCQATHGPSGVKLITDAPKDNLGEGQSFSPTDLAATALATCMLTTMAIYAQRTSLPVDLSGMTATIGKEMSVAGPRRIARLPVTISIPHAPDEPTRQKLQNAALSCPVKKSLSPEVEMPVEFQWGEAKPQMHADAHG
jgi:putative redox protein